MSRVSNRSSSSQTQKRRVSTADLLTLRSALERAAPSEGEQDTARTLDIVRELEAMTSVGFTALVEAKIAPVVAGLRSHEDADIAALSKTVIKRWKKMQKAANAKVDGESKQPPRRVKTTKSTAERERQAAGKAPYSSGPNKSAPRAEVLEERAALPTRNAHGELVFPGFPKFRPNLTPKQVLQMGSFGGTYFRPIDSAVTGLSYRSADVIEEYPADWFEGLRLKTSVTSSKYILSSNKYGVKCGGDLDMWESSGWISDIDPYGWFQWYCRFYLGRRSTDDDRQIARGLGVMSNKGRFRNQLIGKCARAGKRFDDASVSPVIRQALQHWGYQLTQRDADAYVKLKGLPTLPR